MDTGREVARLEQLTLARQAHEEGRVEDAIRHLYDALSHDVGDADVMGNLAAMLAESGREAEAARLFERAMSLADPGNFGVRMNYAAFLGQLGRVDEAVSRLEELSIELIAARASLDDEELAVLVTEQLGVVEINLARALVERGDVERARRFAEAWLTSAGHWEAAQEVLDLALLASGEDHVAAASDYLARGVASVGMVVFLAEHRWFEERDCAGALRALEQGLRYLPDVMFQEFSEVADLIRDVERTVLRRRMASRSQAGDARCAVRARQLRKRLVSGRE